MSGTSIDGADAILADFTDPTPRVIGFQSVPFASDLRADLLALNAAGDNEIERSHLAANRLAECYANAVTALLKQAGVTANEVIAAGCHGQTVRHRPDFGFTVQLNNPALIAELIGIDTVADFRSRDVAAGGQGAPLVPVFHDGVFRSPDETRVVVNIGGIANVTILQPGKPAWGFDCGPGNCLMDAWIDKHRGTPFDENGCWAAQGQLLAGLASECLADGYFCKAPPKSTGRDHFHLAWLERRLTGSKRAVDVQATLLELTAVSIATAIQRYAPDCSRALLCGGGAQNGALMARISQLLPGAKVDTTNAYGVPAQQVEALAFAWLAKQTIQRSSVDLRSTTGSRHAVVLGAIYPK